MTWKEFVKQAHWYFKKPQLPNEDTFAVWREEIGQYPDEFYTWAWDSTKNREDRLPDNIPRYVKSLWNEWLRANPYRAERREFNCTIAACEEGLLFVKKDGYSWVFRCADCDARPELMRYPVKSLAQLRKEGYELNKAVWGKVINGNHERLPGQPTNPEDLL